MKPHDEQGFRRRVIAVAVVVGLILLAFLCRLVWLQLVNGAQYAEEAAQLMGAFFSIKNP